MGGGGRESGMRSGRYARRDLHYSVLLLSPHLNHRSLSIPRKVRTGSPEPKGLVSGLSRRRIRVSSLGPKESYAATPTRLIDLALFISFCNRCSPVELPALAVGFQFDEFFVEIDSNNLSFDLADFDLAPLN